MGYIGIKSIIWGNVGIMEKKMKTLGPLKGIYRVIEGNLVGSYRDNGNENGSYYLGFRAEVGYCPHPVTVYIRGHMKGYAILYNHIYIYIYGCFASGLQRLIQVEPLRRPLLTGL